MKRCFAEQRRLLLRKVFNHLGLEFFELNCFCFALQVAALQKCARVQFTVRDSNKSAINFYKHQGAIDVTEVQEWHLFRLISDAIEKVAAKCVK